MTAPLKLCHLSRTTPTLKPTRHLDDPLRIDRPVPHDIRRARQPQRVQLLLQQAQRFDLMMNARDLLVDEMVDVVARIRFDDQSAQLQRLAQSRRAPERRLLAPMPI
jgi:hypothetical protein